MPVEFKFYSITDTTLPQDLISVYHYNFNNPKTYGSISDCEKARRPARNFVKILLALENDKYPTSWDSEFTIRSQSLGSAEKDLPGKISLPLSYDICIADRITGICEKFFRISTFHITKINTKRP